MKRIGLILLAVVMVAGMVGCGDDDANPVGTWAASWDNGCNGTDGSSELHLYINGTSTDSFGNTGRWTTVEDVLTINYDSGAIWNGTIVNNNAVAGRFTDAAGGTGCWSATKLSDTP